MSEPFYATTPIYYVNAHPHIGHAYTTIVADIFTRFHKLFGDKTFFLTGTDEHGQKIAEAAAAEGISEKEFCDRISGEFMALWPQLSVEHDHFVRTTDDEHKTVVKQALQEIHDRGHVYKDEYSGLYCQGCERYLDKDDLDADGNCVDHKKPPEHITEGNYFFKMSAFQDKLIQHIEDNPDWIFPDQYRKEILGFLREPLQDLCITRPKTRLTWGVDIPFDDDYVTYVWFDALLNYCSALGYRDDPVFELFWPHVHHFLGKDIVKTHCVYWPTMLMALELPLPKKFVVHGYWNSDSAKMSKSLGNVVSPLDLKDQVGTDPLRYFLAAAMSFGQDADFSEDIFRERYNADLANNLGNLISRTLKLTVKNFDGQVPSSTPGDTEVALRASVRAKWDEMVAHIQNFSLHKAAQCIPRMCDGVNKYIEDHEPWKMAKDPAHKDDLARVLGAQLECLRLIAGAIAPIMPGISHQILDSLGVSEEPGADFFDGCLQAGQPVTMCPPLFPRIRADAQA